MVKKTGLMLSLCSKGNELNRKLGFSDKDREVDRGKMLRLTMKDKLTSLEKGDTSELLRLKMTRKLGLST